MNTSSRTNSQTSLLGIPVVLAVIAAILVIYAMIAYTIPVLVAVATTNIVFAIVCAYLTGYISRKEATSPDYAMNNFFILGSFILLLGVFTGVGMGQVLGYGVVGASAFAVLYFLLGNMAMRGVVNRFLAPNEAR